MGETDALAKLSEQSRLQQTCTNMRIALAVGENPVADSRRDQVGMAMALIEHGLLVALQLGTFAQTVSSDAADRKPGGLGGIGPRVALGRQSQELGARSLEF